MMLLDVAISGVVVFFHDNFLFVIVVFWYSWSGLLASHGSGCGNGNGHSNRIEIWLSFLCASVILEVVLTRFCRDYCVPS